MVVNDNLSIDFSIGAGRIEAFTIHAVEDTEEATTLRALNTYWLDGRFRCKLLERNKLVLYGGKPQEQAPGKTHSLGLVVSLAKERQSKQAISSFFEYAFVDACESSSGVVHLRFHRIPAGMLMAPAQA